MYEFTNDPDVILNTETGAFIPRGHTLWYSYEEWLAAGNVPTTDAGPGYTLYSPEHFRAIRDAAAQWLLSKAKERGYDSVESCVGYYNSTRDRYQREARAMVAWRDAVYGQLEFLAINPPTGIETWEQAKQLLPQPEEFDFPEDVQIILPATEDSVQL